MQHAASPARANGKRQDLRPDPDAVPIRPSCAPGSVARRAGRRSSPAAHQSGRSSCSRNHSIVLAAVCTCAPEPQQKLHSFCGALVPVDELVELERVELAAVIPHRAKATPRATPLARAGVLSQPPPPSHMAPRVVTGPATARGSDRRREHALVVAVSRERWAVPVAGGSAIARRGVLSQRTVAWRRHPRAARHVGRPPDRVRARGGLSLVAILRAP